MPRGPNETIQKARASVEGKVCKKKKKKKKKKRKKKKKKKKWGYR